jgi:hypothetical protein
MVIRVLLVASGRYGVVGRTQFFLQIPPKCLFKGLMKSTKTSARDLRFYGVLRRVQLYSAVHSFWLVKQLAELADGPNGSWKVARGGCPHAWNFSGTRSNVHTEAQKRTVPNMTLQLH